MDAIPRACLREGHGPSIRLRRRLWWAPWRIRQVVACWVCHTPLSETEARQADERWLETFIWWRDRMTP
jgi:hypothetical protein